MEVYWTLAPDSTAFGVGLWPTAMGAAALEHKHTLAIEGMGPIPVYVDGLPDALADQLVALGVAEDVVRGFDGTALACKRLATGLLNVAEIVGRRESAAEANRLRWQMAGRVCAWCGRVATAAGRHGGEPRLACDDHTDQLDDDLEPR